MSILGDSISTLKGYIPETNRTRYVQNESEAINGLIYMNFEETWWGNLIEDLNMNLGINDSWAGSRITNTSATNTGDIGPDRTISSMKRIENLGNNGIPDVIFLFGGTNDIGNNVDVGIFNSEIALDTISTIYSDFANAYAITIKRIQYLYPNTDIIVLLPMYTSSYYTSEDLNKYNNVIKEICNCYDLKYIDLTECGITTGNLSTYLVDGIHPNAMGMQLMKNYIKNQIVNGQNEEAHVQELPKNFRASTNLLTKLELKNEYYNGTNWVYDPVINGHYIYSITIPVESKDRIKANSFYDGIRVTYFHDNDVISSLSSSEVQNEYLENGYLTVPENVNNVCIPFWGISDNSYCNLIKNNIVVGDGERKTSNPYAQPLPNNWDSSTNLYEELEYEKGYFDENGEYVKTGDIISVTIPVLPSDRINSNSFGRTYNEGIRVTFFYDSNMVESLSPGKVYEEYSKNGYLTVPDNVNCVCVSWWKEDNSNYLYLN